MKDALIADIDNFQRQNKGLDDMTALTGKADLTKDSFCEHGRVKLHPSSEDGSQTKVGQLPPGRLSLLGHTSQGATCLLNTNPS